MAGYNNSSKKSFLDAKSFNDSSKKSFEESFVDVESANEMSKTVSYAENNRFENVVLAIQRAYDLKSVVNSRERSSESAPVRALTELLEGKLEPSSLEKKMLERANRNTTDFGYVSEDVGISQDLSDSVEIIQDPDALFAGDDADGEVSFAEDAEDAPTPSLTDSTKDNIDLSDDDIFEDDFFDDDDLNQSEYESTEDANKSEIDSGS